MKKIMISTEETSSLMDKKEEAVKLAMELLLCPNPSCFEYKHAKLKHLMDGLKVLTYEELNELANNEGIYPVITGKMLRELKKSQCDAEAFRLVQTIECGNYDGSIEKLSKKIKAYNRKGNGLLSGWCLARVEHVVFMGKVRKAFYLLDRVNEKKQDNDEVLQERIEELLGHMKSNRIPFSLIEVSRQEILEWCTYAEGKIYNV